jgi:membrane glycosyltransferase
MAVGGLLVKNRKFGIGILAAWGGVMLGFMITTMFVMKNVYMYYGIIVACAVILFIVAIKVETIVIILLTSFIGSYAIIRGISMYAGDFPDETQIRSQLDSGIYTWDTFPKAFYAYVAGILVMTVLASVF